MIALSGRETISTLRYPTFTQAALGADVFVRTIEGEEKIKIPAGTQTGTVIRIKGKGMPVLGGRGRGDLYVSASVVTPSTLTREQRKLLEQLALVETRTLRIKAWSTRFATSSAETAKTQ